ncbi:Transcriptional activator protein Anr [compost metagenome]
MSIDGREFLTGIYSMDEYFGIPSLISHEPYSESAEALEDATVCLLPKDMVEELLNKYPDVTRQFIHMLSNNLLEREEQLLQLAYHSVRKRMADVLVRLCKQEKVGAELHLKISRDNLAAMAGMATETVSRILSDFRDEGILDKKGNQIVVLDALRLQNMKN